MAQRTDIQDEVDGIGKNITEIWVTYLELNVEVSKKNLIYRRPEAGESQWALLSLQLYSIDTADMPKQKFPMDMSIMTPYAEVAG